jgi:hypothetical protein
MKLTIHFQLVPRSKKHGPIQPLPHISSFGGAQLVKQRNNFIFYLTGNSSIHLIAADLFEPTTRYRIQWGEENSTHELAKFLSVLECVFLVMDFLGSVLSSIIWRHEVQETYRRFEGKCCLRLQSRKVSQAGNFHHISRRYFKTQFFMITA